MKHIKKITIALFFALSFNVAFAGGNSKGSRIENSVALQERVHNMINLPVLTGTDMEGTLDLVFRVNELGRLEVLRSTATHTAIAEMVQQEIDNERFNVSAPVIDKVYHMTVRYGN